MICLTIVFGVCTFSLFWYFSNKKSKHISLNGKTVVIVGASSGIGEACAEEFHKEGCRLILCARRIDELERVKQKLLASDVGNKEKVEIHSLDITDSDNVKKLFADLSLDILVNNAGIGFRGKIIDTDMQVHKKIMNVNYFGQVEVTNSALPSLLKQGSGHIVFISSLQGKLSIPFRSAYSASKHALQAFADCLRAEVHENNIKVTVVSPGYVKTSLSVNALQGDGGLHGVMDENQLKGLPAKYVAQRVIVAVKKQQTEVLVCSKTHELAVSLRNLLPGIFFKLMQQRAKNKP